MLTLGMVHYASLLVYLTGPNADPRNGSLRFITSLFDRP
jgi:hypothetical protein